MCSESKQTYKFQNKFFINYKIQNKLVHWDNNISHKMKPSVSSKNKTNTLIKILQCERKFNNYISNNVNIYFLYSLQLSRNFIISMHPSIVYTTIKSHKNHWLDFTSNKNSAIPQRKWFLSYKNCFEVFEILPQNRDHTLRFL